MDLFIGYLLLIVVGGPLVLGVAGMACIRWLSYKDCVARKRTKKSGDGVQL